MFAHSFPMCWWTWRSLVPTLDAGYRVRCHRPSRVHGGGDHPPRGYDLFTLSKDVAAIIRSPGRSPAGRHRTWDGRDARLDGSRIGTGIRQSPRGDLSATSGAHANRCSAIGRNLRQSSYIVISGVPSSPTPADATTPNALTRSCAIGLVIPPGLTKRRPPTSVQHSRSTRRHTAPSSTTAGRAHPARRWAALQVGHDGEPRVVPGSADSRRPGPQRPPRSALGQQVHGRSPRRRSMPNVSHFPQ